MPPTDSLWHSRTDQWLSGVYAHTRPTSTLRQSVCALLLYTAEHEQFVAYHLAQFPLSVVKGARIQLTPREKDVLLGLIRGESGEEMALKLGITKATVHTHVQRLYTTLNVRGRQQAIFRAFELRLVDWLDIPEKHKNSQE